MTFQTPKTPTSLICVKRGMWKKRGRGVKMTSASPCSYSELRSIAANGRGLRKRSEEVGVWREKGAGGEEGVGGAGVRMKIDLLHR